MLGDKGGRAVGFPGWIAGARPFAPHRYRRLTLVVYTALHERRRV
jgi:hypothetical protein